MAHPDSQFADKTWHKLVSRYQSPSAWPSVRQVLTSFIPFFIIWYLMYRSLEVSYWLTLLLAIPGAGFVIRIFIIQHDCGHGSFFKSTRWNDRLGALCGLLTLTPYRYWRKGHAIHHASAGNLAERGLGDLETLTVREYLARSKWERFKYRVYRHPLFLFVIAPTAQFIIMHRIPRGAGRLTKERSSVLGTNLAIACVLLLMTITIGMKAFLLVQFPLTVISTSAGMWLFYVQHQFEDTYWAAPDEWDYGKAGLEGSSYLKLPRVLQWFTGNIGFHHIHHLSPRIPNYLLERCHVENPPLQKVHVLTLGNSLGTMFLTLWDEKQKKLVSFRDLERTERLEGSRA